MAYTIPEVALQKVIQRGIINLRANKPAFDELFLRLTDDTYIEDDYGSDYTDKMWSWFSTTKIPVIQAWSFNSLRVPAISVHLASESEDESKSAVGDYLGMDLDEDYTIGVNTFKINLDIGIHASQNSDQVLWMYYMVHYILFKEKRLAEEYGLQLHTFSASDYSRDSKYFADNVFTRWIRFSCTVENTWNDTALTEYEDIDYDISLERVDEED